MANREFSSTLKNLKFMQRAAKREDKSKEEDTKLQPGEFFGSSAALNKKCMVIMEGNPHPGAVKGRMSFQNFNPSIDKMSQDFINSPKVEAFNSSHETHHATTSNRDDLHSSEYANRESPQNHVEVDHKRKQSDVEIDDSHPPNPQRNFSSVENGKPFSKNKKKSSYMQHKREKLDWNVLRPPKAQARKDSS